MRLTSEQVTDLVKAFTPFIANKHACLYLYGSRVHDHLKGGDIDLLLVLDQEETAAALRAEKHVLLAEVKQYLGDQKIDLTIAIQDDLRREAFLRMIFPEAVMLKEWGF